MKLLLLLILSFCSAQGFAGSCPDGSEPVKSVSEDGTYFVFNCGNSSNTNDVDNKSENSTIGQSLYKTITQGDPEIYEAQMLLNRLIATCCIIQWAMDMGNAICCQNFYQELGKIFDGKWSSQILSDLRDRRLITMPRSGPLSVAEKDEVVDKITLKYDDITKLEKPWYQLNQLKFDVVTSDEVGPTTLLPNP